MIDLMRPLYRMMEAKGLPQVRVRPLSAEAIAQEEAREAAQGIAAALTAAAGVAAGGAAAPARKPGQHKVDRRSKKARSQKPVARRAVVMPTILAVEDEDEDETPAREGDQGPGRDEDPSLESPASAAEDEEANAAYTQGWSVSESLGDKLDTYEQRVVWMFLTQMEHWQFTHMHEKNSSEIDADMRKERAMQCARLGLEVERAMLTCVGTKRRRTYGHDAVYGTAGLYRLLGKPYLGATEGNEHAHCEMKMFFKRCCSKNSKTRCACLQVLDLLSVKRLLVHENGDELPWNRYTAMRTGLDRKSGCKQKEKKCSDDTIEDSKDALTGKLGLGAVHTRPEMASMDEILVEKIAKRGHMEHGPAAMPTPTTAPGGKRKRAASKNTDPHTDTED